MTIKHSHVVITGGSSGIGLATAAQCLNAGASHVVVLGSTSEKLRNATNLLEKYKINGAQIITGMCADVADPTLVNALQDHVVQHGPVDILICSAGISEPYLFHEMPLDKFDRVMRVNYLGCVYSIRGVLPGMQGRKHGRLILVSSMAGLAGVVGFGAYCPSKFALRGLAETLSMELCPYGIGVTLIHPPDVDTPLLASENKTKPDECKIISEGSGLWTPQAVAKKIVNSIENWTFFVNYGLDGCMLGALGTVMSPPHSGFFTLFECLVMPIMRLVGAVYTKLFYRTCKRIHAERQQRKLAAKTVGAVNTTQVGIVMETTNSGSGSSSSLGSHSFPKTKKAPSPPPDTTESTSLISKT
eukprot:TRINITY_DN67478_c3_g9_i1.p1 TRINITY_DN67478_c3_g9~~TRINITY_DN67478_c3_g9_i1.p1  ORF type:complete len:411 (+),score=20.63 TRINITY_DN67478_c3_g9_i1:160-1233(+)